MILWRFGPKRLSPSLVVWQEMSKGKRSRENPQTLRCYPKAQLRQGADRESATTRLEGGVHSRRAGAVGHNTEREASCDQDNPTTSADLELVKVAIVVSQL